ncbi:MAG: AraC family transcriptional regulator [Bacteroidota bacterium]
MIISHRHFDLLDKVILERVVFQPPFTSNSSLHDEACFLHIIHGRSRLYTPTSTMEVDTTDSLVMKCGSYLNKWFGNEGNEPNEAVLVHLHPDVLKVVYEDQIPSLFTSPRQKNPVPVEKVKLNNMLSNYVNSLLFYFDNPSLVTEDLIKLKVKEIILLLINTENAHRLSDILGDMINPNQYKFKEIIQEHLYDDLRVEDLAVLAGYSLSSFKRKFKEVFGTSPLRYIKQQRLEKGRELLTETNLRISDIAYDVGFNDLGHFSKSFIAAYQSTPSAYRRQYSPTVKRAIA